ncbi:unnamed protein product, partial [Timema podura]|nr:unnamed protein product [Timema podura]
MEMALKELGRLNSEKANTHLRGGEWKTIKVKPPDRDSNHDLPVLGSLALHETSALAIEAGFIDIIGVNYLVWLTCLLGASCSALVAPPCLPQYGGGLPLLLPYYGADSASAAAAAAAAATGAGPSTAAAAAAAAA